MGGPHQAAESLFFFLFSNRCSSCQLGTHSYTSLSVSVGYAKYASILICTSHCYMSPPPRTQSGTSAGTIHIHIYSRRTMHLSSFFPSLSALLSLFLIFYHCPYIPIKTFTLMHDRMIGNGKEITNYYSFWGHFLRSTKNHMACSTLLTLNLHLIAFVWVFAHFLKCEWIRRPLLSTCVCLLCLLNQNCGLTPCVLA